MSEFIKLYDWEFRRMIQKMKKIKQGIVSFSVNSTFIKKKLIFFQGPYSNRSQSLNTH